jgi:hypothetical protein
MHSTMTTPFYRLRQTSFWGDYGRILIAGLPGPRDEATGQIILRRTGPFTPPIIFTIGGLGYVVLVTESFRTKLMSAGFGELVFRPTIKKQIVSSSWQHWDRKTRLPPELPESGEPEEYILGQPHSEQTASEMEAIWELVAPEVRCDIKKRERIGPGCYRWFLTRPEGSHRGLFRPPGDDAHVLFVDQGGRDWFEQEVGEWIGFDEVSIV